LEGLWSPVGYQVVEVAEEPIPTTEAGPRTGRPPEKSLPWSAAGYQVVEVAGKVDPALAPKPAASPRPRTPRKRRLARWGALTAGGSFLLAAAITLVVIDHLPAGAPALPVRVVSAPPATELPAAPVCAAPDACRAERETAGTAVEFVRNPAEAARVADKERKLMLLLHVSGNFEEARFT
jgi:hypothetical protein